MASWMRNQARHFCNFYHRLRLQQETHLQRYLQSVHEPAVLLYNRMMGMGERD